MKTLLSNISRTNKKLAFFSKGLFVSLVLATFIFGGVAVPYATQAQTVCPTGSTAAPDFGGTGASTPCIENSSQQTLSQGVKALGDATGNILKTIGSAFYGAMLELIVLASYIGFTIANYLLGITGVLFNFAVVYLVFNFATTLGNSPGMLVAWGVLRDFANIILLFGFIFMGVITILDLHSYPVQKTIPKFIIIAVLMNFSLLGTSIIIDGANVLAAVMYNQSMSTTGNCLNFSLDPVTKAGGQITGDCKKDALNVGIAGKIVEVSRIGTVMGSGNALQTLQNSSSYIFTPAATSTGNIVDKTVQGVLNDKTRLTITLFLLAMFVLTAAVVLLAGAVLLISRAIVLAIVLVTSPIGLVARAIPALSTDTPGKPSLATLWLGALVNNAIFAPVFLLMIFVSLKIAEGVGSKLGGSNNLVDALTKGDASIMGGVMVFALVIGFMIASLIAAKKFSIIGADQVNSAALQGIFTGANLMGGAPSWVMGLAPRAVAGAYAKKYRANIPFATSVFGKGVVQTLEGIQKGKSFQPSPFSRFLAAPLAGALLNDQKAAGAIAQSQQGSGKAARETDTEYLERLTKAQKTNLSEVDGKIKENEAKEYDVDLQIKNAESRGDTAKVLELQAVKAGLGHSKAELQEERRKLAYTPAQLERYEHLVAERDNNPEQAAAAQRELDALDRTSTQEAQEITAIETRLADASHQGEARTQDEQTLVALRQKNIETRNAIADRAAIIANLRTRLAEVNNDLADMDTKAIDAFKAQTVREYANAQERLAHFGTSATDNPWITAGTLGLNQAVRLFINPIELEHVVTTLRAEQLKPALQRSWEGVLTDLRKEVKKEVEAQSGSGGGAAEHAAPAPAAAAPAPSGGGGHH